MSNIITVSTVSQLPRLTTIFAEDGTRNLKSDSLFETSISFTPTKYVSKSITYNVLSASMYNDTLSQLKRDGISIESIKNDIDSIKNNDIVFNGRKQFNQFPIINSSIKSDNLADNVIITKKIASDLIQSGTAGYIGDDYIPTEHSKVVTFNNSDGYHSEEFITEKSGNLLIYGWMADSGNILPENAWVALEAKINRNSKWQKIQIFPWIISEVSKKIQYVSFNLNVKSGLTLRISTGFFINRISANAENTDKSLVADATDCGFKLVYLNIA